MHKRVPWRIIISEAVNTFPDALLCDAVVNDWKRKTAFLGS